MHETRGPRILGRVQRTHELFASLTRHCGESGETWLHQCAARGCVRVRTCDDDSRGDDGGSRVHVHVHEGDGDDVCVSDIRLEGRYDL